MYNVFKLLSYVHLAFFPHFPDLAAASTVFPESSIPKKITKSDIPNINNLFFFIFYPSFLRLVVSTLYTQNRLTLPSKNIFRKKLSFKRRYIWDKDDVIGLWNLLSTGCGDGGDLLRAGAQDICKFMKTSLACSLLVSTNLVFLSSDHTWEPFCKFPLSIVCCRLAVIYIAKLYICALNAAATLAAPFFPAPSVIPIKLCSSRLMLMGTSYRDSYSRKYNSSG